MTDVQETWKKHGWVPPSQQEKYTNYWDQIKNPACKEKFAELFILQSEKYLECSDQHFKNNTCRF